MKILSNDEVINFDDNLPTTTELIRTLQREKTTDGGFILHSAHAGQIKIHSLEINALASITATVKMDTSGLYFILSQKNTFLKLPGISLPLYERSCNLLHAPELYATIELKREQQYKGIIIFFPAIMLQDIKPHPQDTEPPALILKTFTSQVEKNKPAKISSFNFQASTQLLCLIKEIENRNTAAQVSATGREILKLLPTITNNRYRATPFSAKHLYDLYNVTQHIQSCISKPLTVKQILAEIGMTDHVKKKYFKPLYTLTLDDYINEQRILSAIPLLLSTEKMETIAIQTGFTDYKALNRAFNKIFKINATKYRKNKTG